MKTITLHAIPENGEYPVLRLTAQRKHRIILHKPEDLGEYVIHTDVLEEDFEDPDFSMLFRLSSQEGYLREQAVTRECADVTFAEMPIRHAYTLAVSISGESFHEVQSTVQYKDLSTVHRVDTSKLIHPTDKSSDPDGNHS